MADEIKPDAKPPAKVSWFSHPDPLVEILWNLASLLVILALINGFISIFNSINTSGGHNLVQYLLLLIQNIFSYLKYIIILFCFVLVGWIVFYYRKLAELRKAEIEKVYVNEIETKEEVNPIWKGIMSNISSGNQSDWRLAILEADIILGDILDGMFLPGDTMGEKLKAVDKSDFLTLDNAWEAHKIRNSIAHEGEAFRFDQREARRVIALYKTVFEEFHLI